MADYGPLLNKPLRGPLPALAQRLVPVAISSQTASSRITPLTIICQKASTLSMDMPLSRLAMIRAPISAPNTVPEPPRSEVPPMTQEAIASSS